MVSIGIRKDSYLNIFVNSFVIHGADDCIMIDSGLHGCREAISDDMRDKRVTLLCTHGHWDHIGNHHAVAKAGGKLLAHPGDSSYYEDQDWHWNTLFGQFSLDFDLPDARRTVFSEGIGTPVKPEYSLAGGMELRFGDIRLSVLHTPGHSSGSMCFLEADSGALFTGDSLMGDGFFNGVPQYCDYADYILSMEKLMQVKAEKVFCDHNAPFSGDQIAEKARKSIRCAHRIGEVVSDFVQEHRRENDLSLGELAKIICFAEGKTIGAGTFVTALAHLADMQDPPSCVDACLRRYTHGI